MFFILISHANRLYSSLSVNVLSLCDYTDYVGGNSPLAVLHITLRG